MSCASGAFRRALAHVNRTPIAHPMLHGSLGLKGHSLVFLAEKVKGEKFGKKKVLGCKKSGSFGFNVWMLLSCHFPQKKAY